MHSPPISASPGRVPHQQSEQLIVRWKTCSRAAAADNPTSAAKGSSGSIYRGIGAREQVNRFTDWLSNPTSIGKREEEFCGLFIFEFDEEGRIVTHTIEHAEETGGAEKASRVVNLTDWLIGRARWRRGEVPELAYLVEVEKRREGRR